MRKRFFLGAGRWLTAIAIGFCLFRLLWDGAADGVPFDTVTAAVVQSVDLSQTKTADGQMLRRLYGLDPAEYAGCVLYYPARTRTPRCARSARYTAGGRAHEAD